MAFFYSVYIVRRRPPKAAQPLAPPTFDFVVFDSIVIGLFVGISLALAQLLHLERAYWVPVSCLAVIQGMSWRAVWDRQLHRLLGHGGRPIGVLGFVESAVECMEPCAHDDRAGLCHRSGRGAPLWGSRAIFITPLTILLADAPTLGHASTTVLIQARFFDTVLGCLVGLLGGYALHSPRFRAVVGTPMRRVIAKLQ